MKGQHHNQATKELLSNLARQQWANPNMKTLMSSNISKALSGRIIPEHTRVNMSQGQKKRYSNPKERERQAAKSKELWSKKEYRELQINTQKQKWEDPKYRAERMLDFTPERRLTQSITATKLWEDPRFRDKVLLKRNEKIRRPEVRSKNSKGVKLAWQNPDYVAAQMRARGCKPNKVELLLQNILNKYFCGKWIYTGDGKTKEAIIGGKCPDFWDEDCELIELFGIYWHQGENPQNKVNHYLNYGFKCLVVWENEIKDEEMLAQKITEWETRHGA